MRLFLEQHGVLLGTLLLLVVSAAAVVLGRKAASQITRFREEQHQRFTGDGQA